MMGSTENVIASEAKQSRAGWKLSGLPAFAEAKLRLRAGRLRSFHSLAMTAVFCFLFSGFCLLSSAAHAACSNPSGDAGDSTYNTSYNVPQYCDGTDWIAWGPLNAGAGSGGCANPAGSEMDVTYNTGESVLQYCDGDNWVRVGAPDHSYTPNAVKADGATYLDRSTALDGASQSRKWTGSFWARRTRSATAEVLMQAPNSRVLIQWNGGNDQLLVKSVSGVTDLFVLQSDVSGGIVDTDWHHYMFSIDLDVADSGHVYMDGVDVTGWEPAYNVMDIEFDHTDLHILANGAVANYFAGDIADFWMDYGTYMDFSVEANRKKFYDGGPVYLGADGSRPTGTAPEIFLSGDTDTWHTNDGTGGDFTEVGTLTDAATDAGEPSGLVGHWKLDETSGSSIADTAGANTGTWTDGDNNDVTEESTVGRVGGALDFDGQNDYIDVGSAAALDNIISDYTVCAWIYPSDWGESDWGRIFSKRGGFEFMLDNVNVTEGFNIAHQGGSGRVVSTVSAITLNEWQHVCGVHDDSADLGYLFVNGIDVSEASNTLLDMNSHSSVNAHIGKRSTSSDRHFEGALDDVRIYDRVLDTTEINTLFDMSCTDPIAPAGEITFNSTSNVMQYCNGSDWIRIGK